jgi:hypothetical protein
MESPPPEGFKPLFRTSPFLDHNGPFFHRENEDGTFVVGLRIQPRAAIVPFLSPPPSGGGGCPKGGWGY